MAATIERVTVKMQAKPDRFENFIDLFPRLPMVVVIIVAAIVSAMAPCVDIVAVVIVAAKDDFRRGRANDSDASAAIHVADTTG